MPSRSGSGWLVLGGLAVFVSGSTHCAFANGLSVLVLGRVIQALGACATSVLSRAIARDLFDGPALARALALTMIAGAAAPGFSPLVGSALDGLFGWRITLLVVAAFGVALAAHHWSSLGETHPTDRRSPLAIRSVAAAYGRLLGQTPFLLPALAVSLVIGGLYTFFASAPAILMDGMNLTSFELQWYFAATVLIVFAAEFAAPRFASSWGRHAVGVGGLLLALAGGLALFAFAAAPNPVSFTAAVGLCLLGMGLINPFGSAIALRPFGKQAGLASALLGILQMACAAVGAWVASVLPLAPCTSLAVILTSASALALAVFLPGVPRRSGDAQPNLKESL